MSENIDKIFGKKYYSLKKNNEIKLLSNNQAYELILLTKWEKEYINERYRIITYNCKINEISLETK